MNYLGIDPGKSGAMVMLSGRYVCVHKTNMPETELDIFNWLNELVVYPFCLIEWIHPAIQGIGKSSMSKLYGNYMSLRMALTAIEIPFEDVKPRTWQQGLGIAKRKKNETQTRWKNRLKAKAQQLFPPEKVTLATADALLIAEFCRRREQGLL